MEKWKEKVVLITGSSSGIGAAIAKLFASYGAYVVINSSKSVDAGNCLASELPGACYLQGNLASTGVAEKLIKEIIEKYGRLDVLINNAGTTRVIPHNDLSSATVDVWREIFELNVFGTWSMIVAAMKYLQASSGSIINITSIAGIRPSGSSIPYAVSKAALNHLTVLLAKVAGPQVRVNAVAPGLIDTPWTEDWDTARKFVQNIAPLKRSGTPEEVADIVVALAGSSYITGQIVSVDGGLSIAT